jgi:hypothetical protein
LITLRFFDFKIDSKSEYPDAPSERSIATAPATCGAAIEVPLRELKAVSELIPAEIIPSPGA